MRALAVLVIIAAAMILAVLLSLVGTLRLPISGHVSEPVSTRDLVFRSFDLPESPPTLPITCCVPDDHDYAAPLRAVPTATPTPAPSTRPKSVPATAHTSSGSGARTKRKHDISGYATWHATGRDGAYAAAGPLLRRAIGKGWRGTQVLVCHGRPSRCLVVTLNDWCLCSHGDRLVDLSDEAFRYLAPLSRGVLKVQVGW